MDEYNFQEGLEESLRRIHEIAQRPRLISVYGWPDSGKSYFINSLARYFNERKIRIFP